MIQTSESLLTVDCGATKRLIKQGFLSLGAEPSMCDGLFLTHSHIDHIKSVRLFQGVKTYATFDVLDRHADVEIVPYEPIHLKDVTITPLALSHDSPDTVGYVFEADGEKLVMVTDTGYVSTTNRAYIRNADYYIFESNHDVDMLMKTNRPMHLKYRILGDNGHLCNEDCASVLCDVIGDKTKQIFLAHLSEEANTRELAYRALTKEMGRRNLPMHHLRIEALAQFETVHGGNHD